MVTLWSQVELVMPPLGNATMEIHMHKCIYVIYLFHGSVKFLFSEEQRSTHWWNSQLQLLLFQLGAAKRHLWPLFRLPLCLNLKVKWLKVSASKNELNSEVTQCACAMVCSFLHVPRAHPGTDAFINIWKNKCIKCVMWLSLKLNYRLQILLCTFVDNLKEELKA